MLGHVYKVSNKEEMVAALTAMQDSLLSHDQVIEHTRLHGFWYFVPACYSAHLKRHQKQRLAGLLKRIKRTRKDIWR